jgi:Mor family transcriptional regulator
MTERDVQIYEAWLRGASLGEIAKRFNMDKQQVKKVISREQKERSRSPT